jgi:hypothetical protein
MGYSHYWNMDEPLVINNEQKKLIKEVLKEYKTVLAWEYDKPEAAPEFSENVLRFNGKEGDGHETFMIEFGKKTDFECCKTAHKGYDMAVMKCLLILSLSDGFNFSSDGDIETNGKWGDALIWFVEKGYESPYLKSR